MKRLYNILKTAVFLIITISVGYNVFYCYDYIKYPEAHAIESAPWYLGLIISNAISVIILIILLAIMWFIKDKKD